MSKNAGSQGAQYGTAAWLDKATELKQVVMDRLAAMPAAECLAVPSPGAWSAAGVVEHLILLEETVPGLWRERLQAAGTPNVNGKSELLSRIVSFAITKTGLRVPTAPELEPKGGLGLVALERRWSDARAELVAALPDSPNAPWVLHPAFGPLSSAQMGRLLASHIEHHLKHWPACTRP